MDPVPRGTASFGSGCILAASWLVRREQSEKERGGDVNGELRLDNRDTAGGWLGEVGRTQSARQTKSLFREDSAAGILPQNINQAASITERTS